MTTGFVGDPSGDPGADSADESRPGPLRVAAAQAESVSGDVEANVATAIRLVEAAAADGARVVVLPELFLTGYDPDGWSAATSLRGDSDERLAPLREATAGLGTVLVVGAAVPAGSSAVAPRQGAQGVRAGGWSVGLLVLDGSGSVRTAYRKQHLFDAEREFFTPGDHGASVVVDGWELGLGVCYDGCFPEHAAAAAADGAAAYLCPSAYYVGSEHRRDLYYAARALDNGIYVVLAGLTGRCGGFDFSGGSAVYDPEGRVLGRVGDEAPAWVCADLDAAEVARVQEMNPILRDRLPCLGARSTLTLS